MLKLYPVLREKKKKKYCHTLNWAELDLCFQLIRPIGGLRLNRSMKFLIQLSRNIYNNNNKNKTTMLQVSKNKSHLRNFSKYIHVLEAKMYRRLEIYLVIAFEEFFLGEIVTCEDSILSWLKALICK